MKIFINSNLHCDIFVLHSTEIKFLIFSEIGSREASFIYAITSAAITYTIASACSKGNINGCGCEISRRPKKQYCRDCHGNKSHSGSTAYGHNKNTWKWSGCSVNVDYAAKFTRKFLDAREIEGDARSLMNLHNNKVGRRVGEFSISVFTTNNFLLNVNSVIGRL